MEQLLPLLIQLIGGGAGGNIAGALLKNINLTKVAQTVIGIIGGVVGGQAINWMGVLESVMGAGGAGGLLGNAGVSGVSGMLLTMIVGYVKKAMAGGSAA
jgi:hypothetical protein